MPVRLAYFLYAFALALACYGVFDLIRKGEFSFAAASAVFIPVAVVRGVGALLGFW